MFRDGEEGGGGWQSARRPVHIMYMYVDWQRSNTYRHVRTPPWHCAWLRPDVLIHSDMTIYGVYIKKINNDRIFFFLALIASVGRCARPANVCADDKNESTILR